MNSDETESICFNQDNAISSLNGNSLKLIHQFTYHSSNISSTEIDVNIYIGKTRTAIERFTTVGNLIHIYQPLHSGRYDTRSIFKWSLTGLNSEFSFSKASCLTRTEEPSLPYYLPIAGGRIIGFIPFPRVLMLCEMQSVLSRIWTHVAMSISYNDNNYTTDTSDFHRKSYLSDEMKWEFF